MEKILKILNKYVDLSIYKAEREILDTIVKEIHELYMEFAEWGIENVVRYDKESCYIIIETNGDFKNINELFNYWLTEIKEK